MRASLVGKPAIPLVSFTVSDIGDRSVNCELNSKASRQNQAESSGSNAVYYVMISRGAVSLLSVVHIDLRSGFEYIQKCRVAHERVAVKSTTRPMTVHTTLALR